MMAVDLVTQAMPVPKLASDPLSLRRRTVLFQSARAAIAAFARAAGPCAGETVLCPAYIGWSPREGSGVLDPLRSAGLQVAFYRVEADLTTDLDDLSACLERIRPVGVMVIHFFGHADPAYSEIVRLGREAGAWVLEDEAHALLTDFVCGTTGRLGDASVLSLHKMLPVAAGGALVTSPRSEWMLERLGAPPVPSELLWDHDLSGISCRRSRNTATLTGLLGPLAGLADPLWPMPSEDEVLQTLPVLLRQGGRDRVYELMNARGYGVVSLYHTLVNDISAADFPASYALSQSILNLPVHQDLGKQQLEDLVTNLAETVAEVGRRTRL
jgi:dTDP-4-amino-4,6-dideoxygalactose transaminase